ncbi:MAG: ribonuclease E activity regulator RraA [Myxococcales bacterium]|nr:ribonuclease E activity regulator RraA [Myxococcales bacterium]
MSFSTADLSDVHGDRVQVVELSFRSFGGHPRFHGPVRTVLTVLDNSKVKEALESSSRGEVLVVDAGGDLRAAMVGDRLAASAAENGWAGVVVVGAVRDVRVLAQTPVGIFALGSCPRRSDRRGRGERDVPLQLQNVIVMPGQVLYADEDGVLVADRPLPLES